MHTRAAARKLAGEVAAAATHTATAVSPRDTHCQPFSPAFKPTLDSATESERPTSLKRKRQATVKKQAQTLRGGWVLPHGMGVGHGGSDTATPQTDGPTAPTSMALDGPLDCPGTAQSGTSGSPIQPQTVNSEKTPKQEKQAKQTRISLRVTKAGVAVKTNGQDSQESEVKLDAPEGITWTTINRWDGGPSKRLRTDSSTAENVLGGTAAPDQSAPELVQMKVEEDHSKSQPDTPKLLVIKGVIVKNNIATKALDKIVVDATQLLDPDFRIMVKRGKDNPYGLTPGSSPYPYRRVPTPEACEEVHRILTNLHGEVKQPEKMPAASLEVAGCGEVPCVLDALLRTLISGNTLMALADAAIKNLVQHYGLRHEGSGAGSINWEKVRLSSHQELVQVIKVAGNGPKKSSHIKQILDMVYQENLERVREHCADATSNGGGDGTESTHAARDLLSLDYMHGMTKDEAMAKFVSYPGIGIKTAACVTLFCLRLPCFAVDTHVHKFCRWLGWVPEKADPDNCFRHGDFMVPDQLKYGLHQLFIRHGQLCFKCRKATKPGTKEWNKADDCPLEHLLDRSKDEAWSKGKPRKSEVEDADSESDDSAPEVKGDEDEAQSGR